MGMFILRLRRGTSGRARVTITIGGEHLRRSQYHWGEFVMATTTVSGTTVTFSNSGAAADLTQSGTEDGSLQFTFDVLAASGGGVKTTIYSVDDGIKNDDGGATIVVTNKAFVDYNKDLLIQDGVGISFSRSLL